MKKILLVLCAVLTLALLIAGCGGSETKSEDGKAVQSRIESRRNAGAPCRTAELC